MTVLPSAVMRRAQFILWVSLLPVFALAKVPIRLASDLAVSPNGKQIAFFWKGDVWSAPIKGGAARQLTRHPSVDRQPAWSPDGQWIAYQSRVGGQFDIWLIDPDGSVNLPVITPPRDDESPSWSPDSRKIAFSSTRRGSADIYVADANGQNIRRLTHARGPDTSPSWGPYPR